MNLKPKHPRFRRAIALAGGLTLTGLPALAAPFLYAPGDLLLTFRRSGNATDYVVNLGGAGQFSTLAPGSTVNLPNLSASQLGTAFDTLGGVQWAVVAANRPPLVAGFPLQALWVTAPRLDAEVTAPAWLRKGTFVQGTAASQIDAIGVAAAASSSAQAAGPGNTATGVIIPVDSGYGLAPLLGDTGNFAGTFQGAVETVTDDPFDGSTSPVSRADLFELLPGSSATGTLDAPGRWLGYFELKPDGTLTFHAPGGAPPAPTITGIQHTEQGSTVSFTTVNGATYRLRYAEPTELASAPANWHPGASVVGDGTVKSLTDADGGPARYYVIEVLP